MFKGAFGDDDPGLWIENWSWLDANGYLATYKKPTTTTSEELTDNQKLYIYIGVGAAALLVIVSSYFFYTRGKKYKAMSEQPDKETEMSRTNV